MSDDSSHSRQNADGQGKTKMKLDVGCGNNPAGDVNCDLYIQDTLNHRNLGTTNSINVKIIPNFVLCDAHHLPFQSKTFDFVKCSAMIEHTDQPVKVAEELFRVSKNTIIIETNHWFGEILQCGFSLRSWRWQRKHHVSKFNVRWFKRLAQAHGLQFVKEYVIDNAYFPSSLFRWVTYTYCFGVVLKIVGE